jgi:hypothetical protein
MSVVNINDFQLLGDVIQRSFQATSTERIKNAFKQSGLVHVETIPNNSGASRRIEENLHGTLYAKYIPESGAFPKDKRQIGYYKDTVANKFGLEINISLEARMLGKSEVDLKFIEGLTAAYSDKVDLDLSMQFSEGFSATYTDEDGRTRDISTGSGQSLWNTAHTLTGSGVTYRNIIANNPALSQAAIELGLDVGRLNSFTNNGEQVSCDYDILFTTDAPELIFTARRILRSTTVINDQSGATSASPYDNVQAAGVPNVMQSMFRHVVLPRLDMSISGASVSKATAKRGYWGLADSKNHSNYHHEYMKPTLWLPSKGNNGEDTTNVDYIFKIAGLYGNAVVVGRGFVISKGNGDA